MESDNNDENPKEEHLEPTKIETDKTAEKDTYENPDLSHDEMEERMDLYSRIGDRSDQFFDVQRILQKYRKELDDRKDNRLKADVHYAQGIRAGLSHEDINDIRHKQEQQDQVLRNDVVEAAKSLYHENTSLSKSFKSKDESLSNTKEGSKDVSDKDADLER